MNNNKPLFPAIAEQETMRARIDELKKLVRHRRVSGTTWSLDLIGSLSSIFRTTNSERAAMMDAVTGLINTISTAEVALERLVNNIETKSANQR